MLDAMAVIIALGILFGFIARRFISACRERLGHSVSQPLWHHHQITHSPLAEPLHLLALPRRFAMPRLKGTPRRGAAWQAAKSRRKRQVMFEKSMAIAARRRRTRGWAIIEEEIPDEGQDAPPALNFVSAHFDQANTLAGASGRSNRDDSGKDEPYSPCYIAEEPPPEPTRPDHGEHRQKANAGTNPAQSHPAAGDYLSLIFDVRHLLDDLVFRTGRLEQRMDLFFAAHSRATQKKQCPTCARPYAFPARWRHTEAADIHMDSKVT